MLHKSQDGELISDLIYNSPKPIKRTLKYIILNRELFSKIRNILYLFGAQIFSSYFRDLKQNDFGIGVYVSTKAMKIGH